MKHWGETYPGACSSRQTVGGRVLRRAVREGRPRFLWGGSSPVWCRYSHATYTKGVTSLSSCSPDQQRALLVPWERKGGVGRCLRTSAAPALAPFPRSLLRRLQCPAPVPCLCRLLCCGPRRSAKQTHSPAIWAKQQRPRLQSVVVQQQEGNTGRAAAAAGGDGGTTSADRYCRLQGDFCMLVSAAMQPALALPPAMGAFACPGTFQ